MPSAHGSADSPLCTASTALMASVARENTDSVLSPSPCDLGWRPLQPSMQSATISWCRAITEAIARRNGTTRRVLVKCPAENPAQMLSGARIDAIPYRVVCSGGQGRARPGSGQQLYCGGTERGDVAGRRGAVTRSRQRQQHCVSGGDQDALGPHVTVDERRLLAVEVIQRRC